MSALVNTAQRGAEDHLGLAIKQHIRVLLQVAALEDSDVLEHLHVDSDLQVVVLNRVLSKEVEDNKIYPAFSIAHTICRPASPGLDSGGVDGSSGPGAGTDSGEPMGGFWTARVL